MVSTTTKKTYTYHNSEIAFELLQSSPFQKNSHLFSFPQPTGSSLGVSNQLLVEVATGIQHLTSQNMAGGHGLFWGKFSYAKKRNIFDVQSFKSRIMHKSLGIRVPLSYSNLPFAIYKHPLSPQSIYITELLSSLFLNYIFSFGTPTNLCPKQYILQPWNNASHTFESVGIRICHLELHARNVFLQSILHNLRLAKMDHREHHWGHRLKKKKGPYKNGGSYMESYINIAL